MGRELTADMTAEGTGVWPRRLSVSRVVVLIIFHSCNTTWERTEMEEAQRRGRVEMDQRVDRVLGCTAAVLLLVGGV